MKLVWDWPTPQMAERILNGTFRIGHEKDTYFSVHDTRKSYNVLRVELEAADMTHDELRRCKAAMVLAAEVQYHQQYQGHK
jgi:hypothetical protein